MSSIIPASDAILDRARFEALWRRCSPLGPSAKTTQVWKDLANRYSENHRYYHNKSHLVFCLQQLDSAAPFIDDADTVEMAVWFHDIVFDPMARDNEQRSAALFEIAGKADFAVRFLRSVSEIIIATKHNHAPDQESTAYMLDIDLSSMGLPWEHFFQDTIDIHTELSGIPEKRIYSDKLEFFNALLKRPNIFYTRYFSTCYEEQARENMIHYISLLNAQGYH